MAGPVGRAGERAGQNTRGDGRVGTAVLRGVGCAGGRGGQEISLNSVIKIFEEVSGKKLSVKYKGQQAGDVIKTGADTSLLTEHTSWVSKISITEGIEKQWNWAKSNPSFFVKH